MAEQSDEPPQRSVRLTFEARGDRLYLLSAQRIDAMAPPLGEPERAQPDEGYWLELRDTADAIVYRRPVFEPLQLDAGGFGDDPQQPLQRVKGGRPPGIFTVLVPDLADARFAVISGNTPEARTADGRSRELVRAEIPPVPER